MPDSATTVSQIGTLSTDWRLSLRARNLSRRTITVYLEATNQLERFLITQGMPTDVAAIKREHVESFVVLLNEARSASTATNRYRALQQFFK